jgi:hypothetical protein
MLQEAIREKIGHFFEEVLEKIIHTEKNTREISFVAPQKNTLHTLPHNLPVKFYNWVNTVAGKTLTVQPDFILPDGTFLEAKSGGKTYLKTEKREQLFRMMLYKIIHQEPLSSIRYITLDTHDATDIPIPEIRYESIFESEWKHDIQESDFKTIRQWQSRLTS